MAAVEPIATVSIDELRSWLVDGDELALLDAREQGVFFDSHLFHAACVPVSTLELDLPRLVPRRETRIVWCDAGEGLAERAATVAAALGYMNCRVLDGGIAAWSVAGGELYAGVNVPSKAFGEFVEQTYGTPHISARDLRAMLDDGADLVVLDSRPIEEFRRMSIPTGVDCPGAELVHRVKEMAPDPDTLVVVNCAGRTRSIIGSQSLINAGLENQVVALENGTMGWELAGLDVATGHETHAPAPSPASRAWSEAAVRRVADRFRVADVDADQVAAWLADSMRTTYLLDVRTPTEFLEGRVVGSRSAPGGQLVQATDEYVATRNARLVLIDDNGVRATMTASWLQQLGWRDTVVLAGGIDGAASAGLDLVAGPEPDPDNGSVPTIAVDDLAVRLADQTNSTKPDVIVLDIDTSLRHRRHGHIPGAWWGVRSRLADAKTTIGALGDGATLVLTSGDGLRAELAVAEAASLWPEAEVVALDGGTAAWRSHGYDTETGFDRATTEPNDVWYKPYDHDDGVPEQHMQDYLDWEVALVAKIARDPTVTFEVYPD